MDGVVYVGVAQRIVNGEWVAFNDFVFNAFPVMIAGAYAVLHPVLSVTVEQAALCVTSICGILLVIPMYAITRMTFGSVAAFATALFIAVNPELAEFSCDVLRTVPYLFFSASGIALFIYGARADSPKEWKSIWFIVAAVCIFIAGLVRFEAFAWLGIMPLAMLVMHIRRGTPYSPGTRVKKIVVVVGVFAVVAAAAAGVVRVKTGEWHFARADKIFAPWSLGPVVTLEKNPLDIPIPITYNKKGVIAPDVGLRKRFLSMAKSHIGMLAFAEINSTVWKALHPVGLLLAICGIALCIGKRRLSLSSPLSVIAIAGTLVFSAVFARYVLTHYYLSTRHAMSYLLIAAPFVGLPFLYWKIRIPYSKYVLLIIAVTSFALLLGKGLKPIRRDKIPMQECGEALRAELPKDAVIIGQGKLRPVGYYAQREFITGDRFSPERVRKMITKHGQRYVLINTRDGGDKFIAGVTDVVQQVECTLPATKKYTFELYRTSTGELHE